MGRKRSMAGIPMLNLPLCMIKCCLQEKMVKGKEAKVMKRGGRREKKKRKVFYKKVWA